MKGVVFTEFLEMVEDRFSPETVDEIIDACDLEYDGAYTSVGTYDHAEIVQLLEQLSRRTGVDGSEILRAFGERLFGCFHRNYGAFFEGIESMFAFLGSVESYIHVEVLKLYPDAELPNFGCEELSPDRMIMTYRSARPFADLAEGLIRGCARHFGETIDIEREVVADGAVRFSITKRPPDE